jgi:DNA modification methylase
MLSQAQSADGGLLEGCQRLRRAYQQSTAEGVMNYRDFLERKIRMAPAIGFDVELDEINPALKPHTRALVQWGVRGGRRAFFASFGLHKTATQIETLRILKKKAGGSALIIAPLGVRKEFFKEAQRRFSGAFAVRIKFIRTPEEIEDDAGGVPVIHITNYETVRDGKLDPNLFAMASLDEASVLRSFGSKTYQTFLTLFDKVRFRFVATATPSPNRYKELIHYAGFLGVMDTGQALTRFFQRDSTKANNLTLYPHKEREFYLWLNSWAVFLQRPSDLGFSDDGYELPDIDIRWHEVPTDHAGAGTEGREQQGLLFKDAAMGIQDAAREKRESLQNRIAKLLELRAEEPDAHRVIWHDLEAEREAIERAIPDITSIYGAQDLEAREDAVEAFSEGRIRELATKPILTGSGTNIQEHCAWAIFLGIGHKFNDFIQAIHRLQRFGQPRRVRVDLIYSEAEREIRRDLEKKWTQHRELAANMTDVIRQFGLNHLEMAQVLTRSIGTERKECSGRDWIVANNDCVEEARIMADNSVDLIVTSIPFSNHYEYTPSYNDFGHTDDDAHFFAQMDFLTPELLRLLKPGRLACIHVKDRIMFGSVTGMGRPTVNPFHAKCIAHYQQHGFGYMGMITVVTDVVRENNQTYRLGYTEMCKDGSKMGVGSPEYVLLMCKLPTDRSKSYADDKIAREKAEYSLARWQVDAHAFWRSSGERLLSPEELAAMPTDVLVKAFTSQSLDQVYDYETHVRIGEALEARGALPSTFMALAPGSTDPDVWHDINRMLTLNGAQTQKGLENHVCPLQFDIVDRLIERYSSRGELVFDPFGGLFTVPYRALGLGRKGRAVELNPSYFCDGVKYLEAKERELSVPSLFDLLDAETVLEAAE